MENCQKCEEVLYKGWEVCWKCGHDHNKETITTKESQIKPDLDLNKKTKDSIIPKENLIKPDLDLNKKIMEYKVVNFHPNVKDVDGAKGAATRLETLINTEAKEGWEYYRMEGMNVEVIPTGCGGGKINDIKKTANIQLVVFRKNL